MTVTKEDLTNHLRDTIGLNARETKALVESFFDGIREALASGDAVLLSGFGKFAVRDKPPRPGRNPRTGQPREITARRVVTFHASPGLRARCNPDLALAPVPREGKSRKTIAD